MVPCPTSPDCTLSARRSRQEYREAVVRLDASLHPPTHPTPEAPEGSTKWESLKRNAPQPKDQPSRHAFQGKGLDRSSLALPCASQPPVPPRGHFVDRQDRRYKGDPLCSSATQAQSSSRVLLPEGQLARPEEVVMAMMVPISTVTSVTTDATVHGAPTTPGIRLRAFIPCILSNVHSNTSK